MAEKLRKTLEKISDKSIKASQSAHAKYNNNKQLGHANAERSECERNANQESEFSKQAKAGAVKNGDKSEESTEFERLPPAWQDIAEALSIPNDQIFSSWRRFKATSSHPWQMSRWKKWVERELVNCR